MEDLKDCPLKEDHLAAGSMGPELIMATMVASRGAGGPSPAGWWPPALSEAPLTAEAFLRQPTESDGKTHMGLGPQELNEHVY